MKNGPASLRLTRKGKIVRNIFCILLLAVACYRLLDCPAFGPVHAFRQAERQNLVGRSEILIVVSSAEMRALLSVEASVVVGEQGDAIQWQVEKDGQRWFGIQKKTGGVTVDILWAGANEPSERSALLLLKTELPGASTARVELPMQAYHMDMDAVTEFSLSGEGNVLENGVFLLLLSSAGEAESVETEYPNAYMSYEFNDMHITILDANGVSLYDGGLPQTEEEKQ